MGKLSNNMKNYKVIPNKVQKRIIKCYWNKFKEIENDFYNRMQYLEKDLEIETNIKGIEFFSCDGEYVGVGNADRTMKLIHLR